jgi:TRAP-type C4-dicarboxylate transport system permease small subunit
MKNLSRISNIIERPVQAFCNILLALILVLVFTEVITRYVFHSSHGFMEAFSTWSQIWVAYLMVGIVAKQRGHIVVDVIPKILPKKTQVALLILLDIIAFVFCIFLFWSGIETAQNWRVLGYVSSVEIILPLWIIILCTPLGAIFFAFFSIENLAIDIQKLKQRTQEHN